MPIEQIIFLGGERVDPSTARVSHPLTRHHFQSFRVKKTFMFIPEVEHLQLRPSKLYNPLTQRLYNPHVYFISTWPI